MLGRTKLYFIYIDFQFWFNRTENYFWGDFTTFNNSSQNNITKNADGSLDIILIPAPIKWLCFSTSIQSDSKIIIEVGHIQWKR
jgi:hypothetical protein